MKLGIFTDAHYSSKEVTCGRRYNSRSLQKIEQAYAFFKEEGCDLVVSLGDLIDREDSHDDEIRHLSEIAAVIAASHIPTVCLMGNHDAFAFTVEEFYAVLGGCRPHTLMIGGKRLLFIDACYFKSGCHYQPGDDDWIDTYVPFAEEIASQLAENDAQSYLFIHQNIDPAVPDNHRVANAEALMNAIASSGVVHTVFQGHYHPGAASRYHGTDYLTLPAMCENEGCHFVFEL